MGFDRKATSIWQGDLLSGSGTTTFDTSGAAGPLSMAWNQRAGDEKGSSPEELIAAAHATCYSMAFSGALARAGTPPEKLEVSAVVTFSTEGGAHIESSHLTVVGTVPGIDEAAFLEAAEGAKTGCPVSKALAGNVEITLDAQLKS
jgi:osmotically inducible protein OsmC